MFTLISTTYTESSSAFTSIAALYGGVYYLSKTTSTISSSIFTNLYAVDGGIFYQYDYAPLTITSCTFTN